MKPGMVRSLVFVSVLLLSLTTRADTVIASIKPVSLIAAELLQGVAEVETLLPDGASPHDFSLRPSDRRKIDSATLLIWVGAETEPYLKRVISAADVANITWQESDEEHAQHADEPVDAHDDHGHEDEPADVHDEHEHGDLHPWLSLDSVEHFAERLALRLKKVFPQSSSIIEENERKFLENLKSFDIAARQQLGPVQAQGFFVFHDAYQGLVEHFGLNQVGYFTLDPSRKPGAKHLAQLRQQLEQSAVSCVFVEPQFTPALIDSITRGLDIRRGELDPLATTEAVAPGAFLQYMGRQVDQLSTCLAP